MGNNQDHTHVIFNHNAHKVMKDVISYARIQANSQYYKEILHQKMNKKLGSWAIYMTREKYRQVMNPKSFNIQHLRLIVIWCTGPIFVQVRIPWFMNRQQNYFKFYKL
jgi:hypothetical protein